MTRLRRKLIARSSVNISSGTYDLVKNERGLTFENRGKIRAKGKGDLAMWFVRAELDRADNGE